MSCTQRRWHPLTQLGREDASGESLLWICLTCSVGALSETFRLVRRKGKEKSRVNPNLFHIVFAWENMSD